MNVLFVCTANVCRSATAEVLFLQALSKAGVDGVAVASAGTSAEAGWPACSMVPGSAELLAGHRSRQVDAEILATADLVLAAARQNQAPLVDLEPQVRQRLFTIRQVGRLSRWLLDSGMVAAAKQRAAQPEGWAQRFPEGDPRASVAPLTGDRDQWVVEELDAARGNAPMPLGSSSPDDLIDSHSGVRVDNHGANYEQIWFDVSWLAALIAAT